MSEAFVDLSYRGLALGKRIKLTQVRPASGFLEMPTPMPVGTLIGITTEDGVLLEAMVAEVYEQVTGVERAPGMRIKPKLEADAARTWWKQRVSIVEEAQTPAADADGKVTVRSRRMTNDMAVPALEDDGRSTAVMSVINDEPAEKVLEAEEPEIAEDGSRTVMMNAVDLAALGLDTSSSSSTSLPTVTDEDSGSTGDKSDSKSKKKKKKR